MLDEFEVLETDDEFPSYLINGQKLRGVQEFSYEQDNAVMAYVTIRLAVKPFKEAST